MKPTPVILCSLFAAVSAWAQSPAAPAPAGQSGGNAEVRVESSTSSDTNADLPEELKKLLPPSDGKPVTRRESKSSSSSSSKSESVETKSINGKTVTIRRTRDGAGNDKVTITTTEPGGKPKVEEMSGQDYDAKHGVKKPAAGKTPEQPDKVDLPVPPSLSGNTETRKPAAPGKATE